MAALLKETNNKSVLNKKCSNTQFILFSRKKVFVLSGTLNDTRKTKPNPHKNKTSNERAHHYH